MMNYTSIAVKSLLYYWRTNGAVAFGVMAATAVLCGALIVGDSLRHSLRRLTLERLGKIDEMLIADGFFATRLADRLRQQEVFQNHYQQVEPAILFPSGTVEWSMARVGRRAGEVTVLGITPSFWKLESTTAFSPLPLERDSLMINQALADQLGIGPDQLATGEVRLTVRIPKQHQLPADSPLSKQDDLIESLVDLRLVQILPNSGLGRFGLYPSQADPLNVFLPIELLQESLEQTVLKYKSDPQQANVLFLAGKGEAIPAEEVSRQLLGVLQPSLEDVGLKIKRVSRRFTPGDRGEDRGNQPAGSQIGSPATGAAETGAAETGAAATGAAETGAAETGAAEAGGELVFDYWSLTTDRMVFSDQAAAVIQGALPEAKPVFTYLANEIRPVPSENRHKPSDSGIPFSMVTGIDFDDQFAPRGSGTVVETVGELAKLADDEIVLVQWAAGDLQVVVGDRLQVTYFEPETTHGDQVERTVELKLAGIAAFVEPVEGYQVPRRGPIRPSRFSRRPEITNDPDLTPEVPGITDAESIERWDLPFETASKIRTQDDEYWQNHRTTPKGFVSLATSQRLWKSRFGQVTNFRLPAAAGTSVEMWEQRLLPVVRESLGDFGLQWIPLKRRGLAAASGSTPFDVLFLALSMFVIGSALLLVAILFRLGFQQRGAEVGLMSAVGHSPGQLRGLWLGEMSLVAAVGGVLGVLAGIGYAALIIWGLSNWWVGAISRPFLHLSVSPTTLGLGLLSGVLVCLATIVWSMRDAIRQNPRALLAGQFESGGSGIGGAGGQVGAEQPTWRSVIGKWLGQKVGLAKLAGLLLFGSLVLTLAAIRLAGEVQAGCFLGAGFLALLAGLLWSYRFFSRAARPGEVTSPDLGALAILNARRNPLRSTLTMGLVAVASFLIAAVSAFRLEPSQRGTGGFQWVAKSSQPIRFDLSTLAGQQRVLGAGRQPAPGTVIMPLRYRAGEDASCNNLYQSSQPQVLGVPPKFIEYFSRAAAAPSPASFGWAARIAPTPESRDNPWLLLASDQRHRGTPEDPIPVIIDKNTANYSLKIYSTNALFEMPDDRGGSLYFRTVAFLENTILQGSLLISEADFLQVYPEMGGYQYFLIRSAGRPGGAGEDSVGRVADEPGELSGDALILALSDQLADYGFMARPATDLLENFMRVQNTYLSTFQVLGALGLLLGTIGLAAVQLRSIIERRKELGLLRAVGFSEQRLGSLILLENGILLGIGLAVGIGAALFTTLPHGIWGNASLPWAELGLMFALIFAVGLIASGWAAKQVSRLPLLRALRE
jgi:putative ABC transport system permease protein